MKRFSTGIACGGLVALVGLTQLGGCPLTQPPLEFVAGTTGNQTQVGAVASVDVLAPVSDFSITGGTPVEVSWRSVATTRVAVQTVFLDVDNTPGNGNEIEIVDDLPLTTSTLVIDTTQLAAGTYSIGVGLLQVGELVAFDYATGRITVNQRPDLFFTAPRDNFVFDRSVDINPSFTVAWNVSDPDSVVSVQIFLDPDATPNGNEFLLRESNSQSGDSFEFDLPTAEFEPGTYRLLAIVSDGLGTFSFYAPGSIRLRGRFSGNIDLRGIELPGSTVRGAVFEGVNPRDNAGAKVDSIADLDNDGFSDIVIVSQFGKPSYTINLPRTGVGEAYLIYGRQQRFSGRINLNSTGTLYRGNILTGVPEQPDPIRPSRGITDFAALDDWDLDGVREFAFGMPFTDSVGINTLDQGGYFRTGGVVIVSGSVFRPDLGFPGRDVVRLVDIGTQPHLDLEETECEEGFFGPKAPDAIGSAFTSFLQHRALPALGAFFQGARFSTAEFGDQCGERIARYDFDGLVVAVPNRDPRRASLRALVSGVPLDGAGMISVFFNNAGPAWGGYPWDSTNGPGASATYAGPTENPGVIGIPHGGPYHYVMDDIEFSPGYLVTTDSDPCPFITTARPPTPDRTVRFYGSTAGARVGEAVGVADFNSDGLQDLLIGAPLADNGAGRVYIVLGRLQNLVQGGDLDLAELSLAVSGSGVTRLFDGIQVVGSPGDRLGDAQDSAGDFNGDGLSDVLIGSSQVNNRRGGATVFFGSREVINLTEDQIALSAIPTRGLGVTFVGEREGDLAGARVAGVGDVDGDGLDDVMIAAPNASVTLDIDLDGEIEIDRENCGVVYLIYGSSSLRGTVNLAAIGTEELPGARFIGSNSGYFLGAALGDQGDRSNGIAAAGDVDGDGRADLLMSSATASPRGGRVGAGEVYLLYGEGE